MNKPIGTEAVALPGPTKLHPFAMRLELFRRMTAGKPILIM